MPAERIAMHNIKELLRLKYDCALSHERIARALSISKGVVAKYVKAAEACGVSWAELAAADEARLHSLLGGTPRPRGTAVGYGMPDLGRVSQLDGSSFDNGTVYMAVKKMLLGDRDAAAGG